MQIKKINIILVLRLLAVVYTICVIISHFAVFAFSSPYKSTTSTVKTLNLAKNNRQKTKTVRRNITESSRGSFRIDEWLVNITEKFGLSGSVALFLMLFFWFFSTAKQKEEFIDQIFLWKFPEDRPYRYYLFVAFLVFGLIIQAIYFLWRLKLKNARISELERQNKAFTETFNVINLQKI